MLQAWIVTLFIAAASQNIQSTLSHAMSQSMYVAITANGLLGVGSAIIPPNDTSCPPYCIISIRASCDLICLWASSPLITRGVFPLLSTSRPSPFILSAPRPIAKIACPLPFETETDWAPETSIFGMSVFSLVLGPPWLSPSLTGLCGDLLGEGSYIASGALRFADLVVSVMFSEDAVELLERRKNDRSFVFTLSVEGAVRSGGIVLALCLSAAEWHTR